MDGDFMDGERMIGSGGCRGRRPSGFTLIELMVVLAIMAIIAVIAYPSYESEMEKGRLSEAKAALTEASARMERCYSANGTYKNCWPAAGVKSENGYYNVVIKNGDITDNTYTLTAKRIKAATFNKCGDLTLSSTGQEGVTAGTVADCWH